MTNRDAVITLEALLAVPQVRECEEPPGMVALWHRLASVPSASPKIWMDAYLAAFAITGRLQFVTLDRDFVRYEPHGLDLQLLRAVELKS